MEIERIEFILRERQAVYPIESDEREDNLLIESTIHASLVYASTGRMLWKT